MVQKSLGSWSLTCCIWCCDFCASVYFVSMKGRPCYGYETVNGVLRMKVNTWDSLALSVQGCFKSIICGWMGPLEGLWYFRWCSKHILFCKFLHCCIYNIRLGLCVGRGPRFNFALGQNCHKVVLILSAVSLVGCTCCGISWHCVS